jgi:hypothetical protein
MAKYEPKTKATDANVRSYVAAIEHAGRRADAEILLEIYGEITGMEPKMWGPTMIGYGSYEYEGKSCTGSWLRYLMGGYSNPDTQARVDALRARLGKHKTGASCLYLNKLADVDLDVLKEMIALDLSWMDAKYPR